MAADGMVQDFESEHTVADGSSVWVRDSERLVHAADGGMH
jgi:hypothetical protein